LLEAGDRVFDRLARRGWGDLPLAMALLAPALAVLGLFSLWPMAAAVRMSLYGGKQGMGAFVGLGNYAAALQSPDFQRSALVTAYYVLGTVPATLAIGFAVAWGINAALRGRAFYRTAYFLPYVTSAVAAAMVWRALYNPQSGLFNALLAALGLPAQQWLLEPRGLLHLLTGGFLPPDLGPSLALCCIILFDIWHGSGFTVVVFLAALTAIPRELTDAARIDGAGTRQTLRHVVLPLLTPTLLFLSVVGMARAFQAFNSFYALTHGGGRAVTGTENLILHIYAQFYEYGYWGYGTAAATLMSLAIVALTWIQWRLVGARGHDE
jgi:multiple sugar transport system permease protein